MKERKEEKPNRFGSLTSPLDETLGKLKKGDPNTTASMLMPIPLGIADINKCFISSLHPHIQLFVNDGS